MSAGQSNFKSLRDSYVREKKQIKKSQVSGASTNEGSVRTSDLHSLLQWFDPYVKPRETVENACELDSPQIEEESDIEEGDIDGNVLVAPSCSRVSKVESPISTSGKW